MVKNVIVDINAKAIYVKLGDGRVARTKELAPEVFMDLDSSGKPLGIELLNPGILTIRSIARKYNIPALNRIAPDLERIQEKIAA